MLTLEMDRDLEQRLFLAARRLGRSPADCALSAIRDFVLDCEQAAEHARRLAGGDAVMRLPDGFHD